jgi:SAM-dependent methyltransferase
MSHSPFRTHLVQWLESRPLAYMAALVALNVKATVTRPSLGSSEVERHSTQGFVESIEGYFADYLSVAGLRPDDLHGLSVLELGSGDSYGVALKFIQHGARRVVCTDRFESQRSMAGETRVYRQLLEAAGSESERWRLSQAVRFTDEGFAIDERWIQTLIAPAEHLGQYLRGEQFDLIVSRSTLEHVYDLAGVFRSLSALLCPGGRTVHKVDFENHGLFAAQGPVYFLRFPRWLWQLASSHSGLPNRRRKSDFLRLIAKFGLIPDRMIDTALLSAEEVRVARTYLSASRISDEDLAVQGIFFTARKAAS